MAKRKKITKVQKAKVDSMAAYGLDIHIETGATHLEFFTGCFQNITGFYLIQGDEGKGDKLRFSDIHLIYQAALKDKDFSAYVAAGTAEKDAQGSSKAPADDPSALKGQNTAPDGNLDKGGK